VTHNGMTVCDGLGKQYETYFHVRTRDTLTTLSCSGTGTGRYDWPLGCDDEYYSFYYYSSSSSSTDDFWPTYDDPGGAEYAFVNSLTSCPSLGPQESPASQGSGGGSPSVGAVAGGVVGSLAGVALVVAAVGMASGHNTQYSE
jgi:hypothetical protein